MADGTAIDVCLSSVFSPHRPPLRVRYIAAVNRVNTAAMLPRKVEQRPLIDLSMLSGDVLEDIMIQLWLVDAQAPMAAAVSKSFRTASAGASQATASMDVCPARIPLGTNPSIDPDVQNFWAEEPWSTWGKTLSNYPRDGLLTKDDVR